jgi:alcohol dehydrogenase
MKAVMFDKVGSVRLGEVPKPDIEDSKDILIKVTHAAICGSDLHIVSGSVVVESGDTIGHEAVGVVEKVGSDVKRFKVGDRAVVSVSISCGECEPCRKGLLVFCEKAGMFGHGKKWGGYGGCQAEYLRVPWADVNAEPIPAGVTEEQAMLVSDNLSTGFMAAENGDIKPGDVVVVFGAGPVGCCAIHTARLFGPSLIVSVDMLDYRLEMARKLGADVTINAGKVNVVDEIKKLTKDKGADVAIEAVGGTTNALATCVDVVRGGGKISIVGVFPGSGVEIPMRQMLLKGLQIRAWRANMVNMGRLMSLIEHGKIDVTPLISHRMPLSESVEAYRLYTGRSGNVMKIILNP